MGQIIQKIINDFSLGMTNDAREQDTRYSQLTKNFDAHTYPHKLVPFKSSENGDTDTVEVLNKRMFCVAPYSATVNNLYALGVEPVGKLIGKIAYKAITVGAANDFDDSDWAVTANNEGGAGTTTNFNLFVFYKKTGKIYGARNNRYIWSYQPNADGWSDDDGTSDLTSFTNMSQGLVHSKDDILYVGVDNKIISKNGTAVWNIAALTLPTHLYVTSLSEYGNYLAIACAPLSGFGKSVVYLWDRDTSLATLSESIDWGEGSLFVLEDVDGYLVGVSAIGGGGVYGVTGVTFKQSLIFRYFAGGKAIVFKELSSNETSGGLRFPIQKQKVNNYLYFLAYMTLADGTYANGIWKVGKSPSGGFSVTFDRSFYNDTADSTLHTLYGFIIVGDFAFISYMDTSLVFHLSKTIEIDGTNEYAASSIYETVIQNDGDVALKKKLLGVSVYTEPLPTGGSVVLKYRIDEETSWTTIFTHTTANSLHHSAINIETGGALPLYKEIAFRIESTGGSVITGLKYKSEIIGADIY